MTFTTTTPTTTPGVRRRTSTSPGKTKSLSELTSRPSSGSAHGR